LNMFFRLIFSSSTSIPSSPYSEVENKSSGHGTSLASSSLSSTSSTSHRLPPGRRYPSSAPTKIGAITRHSSFLVTSPPKMAAFAAQYHHAAAQQPHLYDTPTNQRSSSDVGGRGRGLFHLSMPDISAGDTKNGSKKCGAGGHPQPPRQWTHNKKAQHRHHGAEIAGPTTAATSSKARTNLNPKLEAVRKLSSDSGTSAVVENPPMSKNQVITKNRMTSHCDSGLGTPSSLMMELADESSNNSSSAGGRNSQNSQLSKWRSNMSGKTKRQSHQRDFNPLKMLCKIPMFVCVCAVAP
jgi:hypothetical protein